MKVKIKNVRGYPKVLRGKELTPGEEKEFDLTKEEIEDLGIAFQVKQEKEEFECDECGKTFDSKRGLKVHKSKHKKTTKNKEVNDNGKS